MKCFAGKIVANRLLAVVITLISSGVAEPRIVVNHSETGLRVRR